MKGKAADYHMLVRVIREIKVPPDRFRCVLVVFLYVTKVFSESVAKSCFMNRSSEKAAAPFFAIAATLIYVFVF